MLAAVKVPLGLSHERLLPRRPNSLAFSFLMDTYRVLLSNLWLEGTSILFTLANKPSHKISQL